MNRLRKFLRWVRALLSLTPRDPQPGAHPGPSRVLHLADGFSKTACGIQASATNWITVELQHVNCKPCRRLGEQRKIRRVTRVR